MPAERADITFQEVIIYLHHREWPGVWVESSTGPICYISGAASDDLTWGVLPFHTMLARPQGSEKALELVEDMFKSCLADPKHKSCRVVEEAMVPKRLLDVDRPQIVQLPPDTTYVPQYVALSYCWGGDQQLKLTKARKASLENSVGRNYHRYFGMP